MADEQITQEERIPDSKADTGIDEFLSGVESEQGPDAVIDDRDRPRDPFGRYIKEELPLEVRTHESESEEDETSEEEDVALEEASDEQEEADTEPETAIDPPASWTADDRAAFALLPPETQLRIAERESERERGINQKLSEAAEQRKTAEVEREAAKQERQQLAESLQATFQYAQQMDPVIQQGMQTDWAELAREDPDEYTARKATFDQRVQFLQSAKAEMERVNTISHTETVKEQNSKLNVALPHIAEDADKAWQSYLPTLRDAGYTDNDVSAFRANMTDHRQVVLIDKAAKYDEILAQRKTIAAKKAVKTPPKVQKPKAADNPQNKEKAELAALRKRINGAFDPTEDITKLFERDL